MPDFNKPFMFTVMFTDSDFICKHFATKMEANEAMEEFLAHNTRPTTKVAVEEIF